MTAGSANQGRFLGTLLGMGIGDALGMPVAGWSRDQIRERFRTIDDYPRYVFADGTEIKAGEFTDDSEIALCVVETATANGGVIDPDLLGPRMVFLSRGESSRWMHPDTLQALETADETQEFRRPLDDDGPASPDVAARGIPVGLLHAVGRFDEQALRDDAEQVVRVTHGSPVAIAAATAVAYGVALAARGVTPPVEWADRIAHVIGGGSVARALGGDASPESDAIGDVVATAVEDVTASGTFEEAVFTAVNRG
ncbi:MAG: ADP-ribosylglycohydrolase family protein, partial [Thermomicrobiales bacterium]|nr:ADP-ribosylglycohydrolase family protein [Thermomicrobiales bacterium]